MTPPLYDDDLETEARRLHAANKWLSWLAWDQLSDGSRAEYRAEAIEAERRKLDEMMG